MAGVRLISSSSIKPATGNRRHSTRRLELTPWELRLLLVNPTQKGLLFHKPTPQHEEQLGASAIDHLKRSLAIALDLYFPLAGRLVMTQHNDGTSSFFVDCNDAGAEFIHALAAGISVADILDADYVHDIVDSFFPFPNTLNYEGVSQPLLRIQATELTDGFFIAGVANHSVTDATSFWAFFNSWSEISQNSGEITKSHPSFDRSCLEKIIDFPIRIPFPHNKTLNDNIPPLAHAHLPQKIFHFSKSRIVELKAKANLELGTDNKISSLQAVLGHLWRSVNRHDPPAGDVEVHYKLAVGGRQRLKPWLPESYFGSAMVSLTATTSAGDLRSHGLGWAAWHINQAISCYGADEIKEYLMSWVKNPFFVEPSIFTSTPNTLYTGNSPRFDVYGNDFGWGKPIAAFSGPGNKFKGLLTVFAGKEEGSMDFECCLSKEKLEALSNDVEFLEPALAS